MRKNISELLRWMAYFAIGMILHGCDVLPMLVAGTAVQLVTPPLCEAIINGDDKRAILLIEQGADVNAGFGCPLLRAAERDKLEVVKVLLAKGADPNRYLSKEITPLNGAIKSRDVQMVRVLLEGGADPREDIDVFQTVLNFGDDEMANLLLRHGANANMSYPIREREYTSKQIGPRESQQVVVERRDLEPDRIDATAKRWQCDISGGDSLLHKATMSWAQKQEGARERTVRNLIDHGADPNVRDVNGTTPLMVASSQHDHAVMTVLMDAGADVKATDRCGRTAKEYATLYPMHSRAYLAPQTRSLLDARMK